MSAGYDLERMLNPRTVAVIGDAKVRNYRWIRSLSTFTGKVYSVQIDPNEIPGIEELGIPNYTSLLDIPDEIDYALVAVPRVAAAVVLRDCIAKQVGGVAMFTSGFAETDTDDGRAAQQRVTEMAREAKLPMIGPNCMGLYHPALGVRFMENQPAGFEGDVTFLSQSGGHAVDFSMAAHASGVPVRMAISFGNGVILENADYLEYFGADERTRYIAMYVEGLRDGPRFFAALREAARRKPVVLWKGGLTDAGGRATSSHTASLAGQAEIWEAVFRQTGAIPVTSVMEMVDVLKGLRLWPRFSDNGVGLTGGSGGQSVAMADVFSRAGMRVPALSEESRVRLASWFSLVGASFNNPVDMGSNRSEMDTILDVLAEDPAIDSLVMQVRPGSGDAADQERLDGQMAALKRIRERSGKPVAALTSSPTPLDGRAGCGGPRRAAARHRGGGVPDVRPRRRRAAEGARLLRVPGSDRRVGAGDARPYREPAARPLVRDGACLDTRRMLSMRDLIAAAPVRLAPMASYTNAPYRLMARRCGAGFSTSEEIDAAALLGMGPGKSAVWTAIDPNEGPVAMQLLGNSEETLVPAAIRLVEAGASVIDINMGCPAKKAVSKGKGAALMRDVPRTARILAALRRELTALDVPLTIKIRGGWDDTCLNAVEVARMAEEVGVDAITVHPRTRSQQYAGKAPWEVIADVVRSVRIPVTGNGDVRSLDEARRMVETTGCLGVMVGRGALGRPWVFDAAHERSTAEERHAEEARIIDEHLALIEASLPPREAVVHTRRQLSLYTTGRVGGSLIRGRIFEATTIEEARGVFAGFLERSSQAAGDGAVPFVGGSD